MIFFSALHFVSLDLLTRICIVLIDISLYYLKLSPTINCTALRLPYELYFCSNFSYSHITPSWLLFVVSSCPNKRTRCDLIHLIAKHYFIFVETWCENCFLQLGSQNIIGIKRTRRKQFLGEILEKSSFFCWPSQ